VAERIDVSSSALAVEMTEDPASKQARSSVGTTELASVYRKHHRFVWRALVRLGVPDDRVSDAVHDTFMVVARRLHEFEGRSSLRTWLFAIAMRVAQAVRRDDARELRRRQKVGETANAVHHPHARADAARTLQDLLDHLDDDKRAVFVMAELEGMTAPEIAGVLQVKIATVYSRLRLARSALERVVERQRAADRRKRR
jgi:RNA polymerase sigma-70 factor (ECF subfamily)